MRSGSRIGPFADDGKFFGLFRWIIDPVRFPGNVCQNLLGFSPLQTGEILLPGGIATIVLMPFIGMMLKKGVPAQLMAGFGMLMFFIFSLMLSSVCFRSPINDNYDETRCT